MTYDITPQGIRYTIPSETIAEELATDRVEDAQKPITQEEIDNTIKHTRDWIEDMYRLFGVDPFGISNDQPLTD